jgi:hypothetical protein
MKTVNAYPMLSERSRGWLITAKEAIAHAQNGGKPTGCATSCISEVEPA